MEKGRVSSLIFERQMYIVDAAEKPLLEVVDSYGINDVLEVTDDEIERSNQGLHTLLYFIAGRLVKDMGPMDLQETIEKAFLAGANSTYLTYMQNPMTPPCLNFYDLNRMAKTLLQHDGGVEEVFTLPLREHPTLSTHISWLLERWEAANPETAVYTAATPYFRVGAGCAELALSQSPLMALHAYSMN